MLSRVELDRLKLWQLQLKGAIAAQEHHLQGLERHVLRTGTVLPVTARSLASLGKAIVVCKNTLAQFEEASGHLATLIDLYDRQIKGHAPPAAPSHTLAWCQSALTHHNP